MIPSQIQDPMTPSVWLAEGQSSQRDMLASLQQLKAKCIENATHSEDDLFTILASHRSDRPEIVECADQHFIEPLESNKSQLTEDSDGDNQTQTRWQFVLNNAITHNTKVLLTGRNSVDYERHRHQFEGAGIRLLTGATSVAHLEAIEDKFAFIQQCQAHHIPVATGWRFDNKDELNALLSKHKDKRLCVKPVTGIFAQGFWRLDNDLIANRVLDKNVLSKNKTATNLAYYDSFEHLFFTDQRKINTQQFLSAYERSTMVKERPIPMLLMPYLTGREYSIDVVCERGEVLAAVTRYKEGKVQHIGYDESVMAVVCPLIRAFGCDGIVSVQTKQNEQGQHCVLEINSRPSGGIGYTVHSGVDLTQIAFTYWLGLTPKPNLHQISQQITECQVRPVMTSVKIA